VQQPARKHPPLLVFAGAGCWLAWGGGCLRLQLHACCRMCSDRVFTAAGSPARSAYQLSITASSSRRSCHGLQASRSLPPSSHLPPPQTVDPKNPVKRKEEREAVTFSGPTDRWGSGAAGSAAAGPEQRGRRSQLSGIGHASVAAALRGPARSRPSLGSASPPPCACCCTAALPSLYRLSVLSTRSVYLKARDYVELDVGTGVRSAAVLLFFVAALDLLRLQATRFPASQPFLAAARSSSGGVPPGSFGHSPSSSSPSCCPLLHSAAFSPLRRRRTSQAPRWR
jgi:hypothetical protein